MKIPNVLLVLLALFIKSLPVSPVTVTTPMSKVNIQENSDAVLYCEFKTERDQNPRIEWKKKDKDVSFVYFQGNFTAPFQGRAKIEGATVTLQRVTLKDAGEYRCEVSASDDTVKLGETNITLKVLVPPHIPVCEIPSSALTGSLVALHCKDIFSIPPAVYTWYKDRKQLSPMRNPNATYTVNKDTGVLTFQSITRADAGQYHCESSNGVGPPKSCVGNHMQIDDLNVAAITASIIVVCLIISLCVLGACYAHRQGYFTRHRGSPHTGYGPPGQSAQDFKHTQSFLL